MNVNEEFGTLLAKEPIMESPARFRMSLPTRSKLFGAFLLGAVLAHGPHAASGVDESLVGTVVHVDNGHAHASDDNDGLSAEAPLRTVRAGASKAVALNNGGHHVKLLIHSGIYREVDMVDFHGFTGEGKHAVLVVEGENAGEVILFGARQWSRDEWVAVEGIEGLYKHEWPYDWGPEFSSWNGAKPSNVVAHRREIVFVDGVRLQQVLIEKTSWDWGGREYVYEGFLDPGLDPDVLSPGSFGVAEMDSGHARPNTIYVRLPVGTRFEEASVEVSVTTAPALRIWQKNNLVLRNIVIEKYSGYHHNQLTLGSDQWWVKTADCNNWLVEKCEFRDNGSCGLWLAWVRDVTVRDCRGYRNGGDHGIYLYWLQDAQIVGCETWGNNWRGRMGTYTNSGTAGITISGQRVTVRDHYSHDNYGDGLRQDHIFRDYLIEDCRLENNSKSGMFIEIAPGPGTIRRCLFKDNTLCGFMTSTSDSITFDNCTFVDNVREQMMVFGEERTYRDPFVSDVFNNEIPLPGLTAWEIKNCTFTTSRGPASLIYARVWREREGKSSGVPGKYVNWFSHELKASNNRYWNADTTHVFETSNDFFRRRIYDFDTWRRTGVTEGFEDGSRWGAPDIVSVSAVGPVVAAKAAPVRRWTLVPGSVTPAVGSARRHVRLFGLSGRLLWQGGTVELARAMKAGKFTGASVVLMRVDRPHPTNERVSGGVPGGEIP